MSQQMPAVPEKVGKNFKLIRKIGQGSFGHVYQGINIQNMLQVAIKLQPVDTDYPQLRYQYKLYKYLLNVDPSVIDKGIPNVYYSSTEGDYHFLVMDLMGPCLESLFDSTLKRFSLKTVLMIMDQMLARIECLHTSWYVHRDIKPANFVIGLNKAARKIFLIDLGLAKRYVKREDGTHKPYREGLSLVGTAIYSSLNTHLGIQQFRRDDLESIGYVIMHFLRGRLPWQSVKAENNREKLLKIKQKKISTPIETLCRGYPSEFSKYFNYCRNLRFDEKPDYAAMRSMFRELFQKSGYKFDYKYDWTIFKQKDEKAKNILEEDRKAEKAKQEAQKAKGAHQEAKKEAGKLQKAKEQTEKVQQLAGKVEQLAENAGQVASNKRAKEEAEKGKEKAEKAKEEVKQI